MPSVSIVIPNYNHEKFLRQRIDSILNQTYQDFELIILDDCSKDKSREVIENYRTNSKVSHIIYNDTNTGSTFKQWRKGIAMARGEFVWIAESDDWADPHFLSNCTKVLEDNSTVGIVFTQSYEVNQSGEIVSSTCNFKKNNSSTPLKGIEIIKSHFLFGTIIWNSSSCLFRRSNLINITNKYSTLVYRGDWMFYVSVLLHSDLYYIPEKLNYFRCHYLEKVTSRAEKSGIAVMEVYILHKWLVDNIKLERQLINKVKLSNAQKWMGSILSRNFNFKIGMHIRILFYAFKFDKFIFINLIKGAVYILKRKYQ